MSTNNTLSMYETVPVVSELNKVPGFDPLRFLRKTKDGWNLDLKIKKLWFRLKYPTGRIKLSALKITDQLAIIEARVYFDKNDTQPVSSFTSHKENKSTPGGLYIESAQHSAIDEALSAAGFGIQFVSAQNTNNSEAFANNTPVFKQNSEVKLNNEHITKEVKPSVEISKPKSVETVTDNSDFEEIVDDEEESAPVTEQIIDTTQSVVESENTEIQETSVIDETYTKDMDVDKICSLMSIEEAGNIIVPAGTCKGWTLSQVAERRPVSLKWYLTGYNGDDNILRAGAKMLLNAAEQKMAS